LQCRFQKISASHQSLFSDSCIISTKSRVLRVSPSATLGGPEHTLLALLGLSANPINLSF
jgi:hypothetical protein